MKGDDWMEGECDFDLKMEIPENLSIQLYQVCGEFISENEESINILFEELLQLERAAFMVEIAAPIKIIYQVETLLIDAGYQTLLSIGFDVCEDIKFDLQQKYPHDIIVAACVYISLHDCFIKVAELLVAGIQYPTISGLLFGYQVKNIIGFNEQ